MALAKTFARRSAVDVDGRLGCAQHLLAANGDRTWFCYVQDPADCPVAEPSQQFPGAYYRSGGQLLDVMCGSA